MDIQWYPGHMTRAKRQMEEDIRLIDLIVELIDARIPSSGRNPDIKKMGQNKGRLIVLAKADLADPGKTDLWKRYYQSQGCQVMDCDARSRASLKTVQPLIREACREKIEHDRRRGIRNRPIRAMVAGIPNVGKSTFINSVSGRASARTGNKPGVTKGKQWIHLAKDLDLLDTPGILWPKFDDPEAGTKLALIGSVRDEVLNTEELSLDLIRFLKEEYPGVLQERYQIDEEMEAVKILFAIAASRGCITKGGEYSTEKAASILLDEFRSGTLGRVTLEVPAE